MSEVETRIATAGEAVKAAENQFGKDELEVSYKLDELAEALKEAGRLLDAANATARAKAIRAARFSLESKRQKDKLGDVPTDESISAVGYLKLLYRAALIASALALFVSIFLPSNSLTLLVGRELLGSLSAATFLQLLLFPIKTLPRWAKYIVVAIVSGVLWAVLGGGF